MSNPKGSRRSGRERALKVLYGFCFTPPADDKDVARAFELCPGLADTEQKPEVEKFAWEIVSGVWDRFSELDKIITEFSRNWRLERIAKIELSILRIALLEMLHRPDIPLKVTINEAVEMAKRFGDENSRSFVNGILDAVAKAVNQGKFGIRKEF